MGNAENGKLSWVLAPEERFAAFEPASARRAGSQSTTGSSAGTRVVWWQPRSRPTSAPPPRSTAGARGPAPRPAAGCGTPPAVRTHSPGGQFHPGRAHPRAKSVMPLQCPFDGRLPDLRRAQGGDAGATIRRADTARPPPISPHGQAYLATAILAPVLVNRRVPPLGPALMLSLDPDMRSALGSFPEHVCAPRRPGDCFPPGPPVA
jgi:hypothetical protein